MPIEIGELTIHPPAPVPEWVAALQQQIAAMANDLAAQRATMQALQVSVDELNELVRRQNRR